ncbi:MAG: alpha-glucan family phosphorylase [Candidatus Latescibacterota bacterium]
MPVVAYFSAEIGLQSDLPTYSGGLGVLAGDHLKAAADAGMDIAGVTLLYRQGYFEQHLDENGVQSETYPEFDPASLLDDTGIDIQLPLDGTTIHLRAWKKQIEGVSGQKVDIIFLGAAHAENSEHHQQLSWKLYGGDNSTRIRQEYILGVGGVRALQALGKWPLAGLHLNEGHCAFALLELSRQGWSREDLKNKCLFTTHTPVPEGHDRFAWDEARGVLGDLLPADAQELAGQNELSMSHLAVSLAGRVNGVSKINAGVAGNIFPGARIESITNGIHHLTWTCPAMASLYDRSIPGWRENPKKLSKASRIPDKELLSARSAARASLRELVRSSCGVELDGNALTIGFARRFAPYKRANLLFSNVKRLISICEGKVQFVFAGKAHPNNETGKEIIRSIFTAAKELRGKVNVVFLPNYSMSTGLAMTSGVDVWLNNPVRPLEASGTSGMKASMNGVPNLSILDGWWPEACMHGVNGWSFGDVHEERTDDKDANALYFALEKEILPAWSGGGAACADGSCGGSGWTDIMRAAIATSARFTAARMVMEYDEIYASFA